MKPTPRRSVPFTTGRRFHEISWKWVSTPAPHLSFSLPLRTLEMSNELVNSPESGRERERDMEKKRMCVCVFVCVCCGQTKCTTTTRSLLAPSAHAWNLKHLHVVCVSIYMCLYIQIAQLCEYSQKPVRCSISNVKSVSAPSGHAWYFKHLGTYLYICIYIWFMYIHMLHTTDRWILSKVCALFDCLYYFDCLYLF